MMKDWSALRRRRARLASRGFTLIELMVVVVLVALLALLATPSFKEARNDRIAFDYARQYQQILVQGRSRAAGTGAAHLALLEPGAGGRGVIRLYAALDRATPGPNPVSSCKLDPDQWTAAIPQIADYRRGQFLTSTQASVFFVDYAELNRAGVNVDMDLFAQLTVGGGTANAAMSAANSVAVCITPAGITYVGDGANPAAAVQQMRASTPFTGIVDVAIQRHRTGTGVGLRRHVMIAGGGAPRLRSE